MWERKLWSQEPEVEQERKEMDVNECLGSLPRRISCIMILTSNGVPGAPLRGSRFLGAEATNGAEMGGEQQGQFVRAAYISKKGSKPKQGQKG